MKFPNLKEHQFSVLMSNSETGIVLNVDLEIHRGDEEKSAYSVFESMEQTKEFINKISLVNDKIEFIIYNPKQQVVEFIAAKYS
ncbi:hypothetical protein [Chryseobacterium sp. OV279]|uniref:hypothetical protein n=1 Tax=Chryseobacterium sp. OV279 TaxID=1500285 RepID=UPI0006479551|nr:hypothetical protein [Chryseobacterium sp. OV279]SHF78554.1 hypothetical protein SAMN02787100_2585 [Chryseobacterium sp. OV279]